MNGNDKLATGAVAAQEAVAWSKTKPTAEGAYYVRGFNLFQLSQYEALVQVRTHHFDGEPAPELVCNIHESTSNADMDDWSPIVEMSEDFEWLGPLVAAPAAAAPTLDAELAQDRMSELCELERDVLDSLPAVYYMDPPDGGNVSLGEQVKRMAEDAALWRKHSSTAAAPGIDLEQFRPLIKLGMTWGPGSRYRIAAESLAAKIDASPKGGSDAPTLYSPSWHEAAPYFECSSQQWSAHTKGMDEYGKQRLANMLAHHCLLARRDELGWIITRFDLIASGRPWWHVSNDGRLTYDYDPKTKARRVEPVQATSAEVGA